jgi:hypothetical protein
MADQNTTVAQLPAGYATLAGVIYAVSASMPQAWSYIAWSRMSAIFSEGESVHWLLNKSMSTETSKRMQTILSQTITRELRQTNMKDMSQVVKHVAMLHLLCASNARSSARSSIARNESSNDLEARQLRHASSSSSDSDISPTNTSNGLNNTKFPTIKVFIYGPKSLISETDVSMAVSEVRTIGTSLHIPGLSDPFLQTTLERTRNTHFERRVNAQAAGTINALVIELVYKAIEMLVACGVILGSSGGAWLGLTLSSMFPQRISAGLYASSYGQVLTREQVVAHVRPHVWRGVGTIWVDSKVDSYTIAPKTRFTDRWRNGVGYWVQYGSLLVVQLYKLEIRDALQFGGYNITRDAIRYILLIIELFLLVVCGVIFWEQLKIKRSRRDIIAGTVYLVMLCAGLTCVILGQKEFLKPIWKFYLTSKIVDPIAAIGAVAVLHISVPEDGKVSPEKWVLLWAMGACTVVW